MTLSDISIKNPVFAWMLMAALIIFGAVSFQRLGVSELPDVDFPVVTVQMNWTGAAPVVMETEVVDVVEDAVMGIEGVTQVNSTARQGQATVMIQFSLERNIDDAVQDVQSKMTQVQKQLPADIDPATILKFNSEDQPIMWLTYEGEQPLRDIMAYVRDVLKNQFSTVDGVGDVFLGGYVEPNMRVWVDPAALATQQLAVSDIVAALRVNHREMPAGYVDDAQREQNVRVMGEAASAEELRRVVIPRRGGETVWRPLTLDSIAQVEDGLDDIRRISRNVGVTSIGLGIRKQRGSNAVAMAAAVHKRVADVQSTLPEGMRLKVVYDSTKHINEATGELLFTLLLSAVLTSFVCWLFLGSLSATSNVLLAIPTSIVGAFTVLYFFGFTLNTFTLLGLSLSMGIVVDDAIMVLENIVRHREMGKSRLQAAIDGAREITFPAVAASVAILAIFVPVTFVKGIIGKFLYQFGVTMSVTVLLSLLEAVTLTPMRCSRFLVTTREQWVARHVDALLQRTTDGYRRWLAWCLGHRAVVLAGAVAVFVGSLGIATMLRSEFVPSQDEGSFLVKFSMPPGSSLERTDIAVREAEQFMASRPDISNYYVAIGGFEGGEINTAMMFISMPDAAERPVVAPATAPATQHQMMQLIRERFEKIPGIDSAVVQDLSLSGFTADNGFPITFTLRGGAWDQLGSLTTTVIERMKASGQMVDIDSNYEAGTTEIRVFPDRAAASARGVTMERLGETVQALVGGVVAGKFTRDGKRYDVRVRLPNALRTDATAIGKIMIRNDHGELTPLSAVARIETVPALQSISRIDRERAVTITANVAQGASQAEALKTVEQMGKELMPPGYRLVLSGSSEAMREAFTSLILTLVLGIVVAYMILGAQFNSFIHPFTVLLALPFSITGALLALQLGGSSLNLYSFIGIILLMGIVKKNSILLVEFANLQREEGLNVREALLQACPVRLRPIIMTSAATIAGAIPPALGIGPGAETRIPMALVVIGGVAVSTFLTLFVVPCAYSALARWEGKRLVGADE